MSSGYKHLYSCVTFILFMVVVNFYKNKIHQAREREASVRAKMRGSPQKLSSYQLHRRETTLDEEASIMYPGDYYADKIEAEFQRRFSNADSLLDRMLKEFPAKCRDMEVFYPAKHSKEHELKRFHIMEELLSPKKARQPPIDPNLAQSNSSMYVFLSVLIILIIAAGVDIAKHIRVNPRRQENIRRLSLQNYQALIREKQKQFRMMKQHCSQPSMSINRSIDETNYPPRSAPPPRKTWTPNHLRRPYCADNPSPLDWSSHRQRCRPWPDRAYQAAAANICCDVRRWIRSGWPTGVTVTRSNRCTPTDRRRRCDDGCGCCIGIEVNFGFSVEHKCDETYSVGYAH
ncbi:uncharacterized protein LOC6037229 [Culex quinquefasciatus]|uniref:uncharacterized protein LOC6037229 n=1 Tax=Culex quinquefasciatus TaxID=7176 RepID=UPI0018E3E882|nr:uncharacterized protein LOC6037229 [Culex quinquefasciatus]